MNLLHTLSKTLEDLESTLQARLIEESCNAMTLRAALASRLLDDFEEARDCAPPTAPMLLMFHV